MNKSFLKKATIVIPTYKRYPYLLRLLKFYEKYQINISILILDSTPFEPDNDELIKLLSADNIIWKNFDPAIAFWDKIAQGVDYINTDYATMCADDDFIIPSAIAECIKFLGNNPDYACAQGLYFHHSKVEDSNKLSFTLSPLYNEGRSAFEDTAKERIQAYFSNEFGYYPFYAIHRTELFRLIWRETKQYVSDWNLHELFSCCLSFMYGKMKILPVFYASREQNTYTVNNYATFKRTTSEDKVKKAIEGVSKHLSRVDDLSLEEAERITRDAIDIFLAQEEASRIQSSKTVHPVSQLLRQIKYKMRIRTRAISLLYYVRYQGCHPSIYPEYLDDFKIVREAILTASLTADELNESRMDPTYQRGKDSGLELDYK